jgi:hypothetical protein
MLVLYALTLYAAIGLATAVAFVTLGVTTVTHASMTVGARILILPGATIFWPLIIARWRKARQAA